jgi:hypothetical protein
MKKPIILLLDDDPAVLKSVLAMSIRSIEMTIESLLPNLQKKH